MYIDTHTHFYDEAFEEDADEAIERAVSAGVGKFILPDTDSSVREGLFRIARRHPGKVFATLGLHPEEVRENWQEEIRKLENWPDRDIVAIGEIGLDYHWTRDFEKEQQQVLRLQLDMAISSDLPAIIHVRDAMEPTLKIIREYRGKGLRGVFHAYSGSLETFRELQKEGDWYAGIGGVVTFKKASIAETVRHIPLDRIVLETDSPYLTPVPHRGERNESSYIPLIAEKISSVKEIPLEQVMEATTENAEKLFGI